MNAASRPSPRYSPEQLERLVLLLALAGLAGVVCLPIPNPWLALLVNLAASLLLGLALALLISPDALDRMLLQVRRVCRP